MVTFAMLSPIPAAIGDSAGADAVISDRRMTPEILSDAHKTSSLENNALSVRVFSLLELGGKLIIKKSKGYSVILTAMLAARRHLR